MCLVNIATSYNRAPAFSYRESMSKYKNEKTQRTYGGKVYAFDSKKEAERFDELVLLLKAGKIEKLALQVPFTLQEGFTNADGQKVRPIKYVADFVYLEHGVIDKWIVEDVKGYKTAEYRLKKKLFEYKYRPDGLTIKEI